VKWGPPIPYSLFPIISFAKYNINITISLSEFT
jgi:hypothetical protein